MSAPTVIDTSAAAPADLHPAIAAPLAALGEAGVRWCLLRGVGELGRLRGDVDLLVHPDDLRLVRRLLTGDAGFVELRAWGRGPHRFFVAYAEPDAAFVKLDVVTALHFGPRQELRTRAAGAVLAGARRDGPVALPAPADAFWLALLHALLDRGALRLERAREIEELAAGARGVDEPLAALVDAACPEGWSAARVVESAAQGNSRELLVLRPALSARWPGSPWAIRQARAAVRIALRRLDRVRPRRPGPTVAVIGGGPRARRALAGAMAGSWPERATTLTGGLRPAWALARARGRLVVLDAPDGGRAAARADVRVRLTSGTDPLELRRSALGAAWRLRVAQQSGRMTSKSRSRSNG